MTQKELSEKTGIAQAEISKLENVKLILYELENHILVEHKFSVNKENIIINGLCFKCKGDA